MNKLLPLLALLLCGCIDEGVGDFRRGDRVRIKVDGREGILLRADPYGRGFDVRLPSTNGNRLYQTISFFQFELEKVK